jgi:hypothetical protein
MQSVGNVAFAVIRLEMRQYIIYKISTEDSSLQPTARKFVLPSTVAPTNITGTDK